MTKVDLGGRYDVVRFIQVLAADASDHHWGAGSGEFG